MRFNDDEGRVLEVHVTNWCDVDVTERVLVEVGEPGLFGRHVPDVRVALGDALDAAKNPDPSLGSILKTPTGSPAGTIPVPAGTGRTGTCS